jgi:hypothetical protein
VFARINAGILFYYGGTEAAVGGGVGVGAVLGAFEEVEGQDEEEGGSDPVGAHQQEESLLVRPERPRLLSELPKSAERSLLGAIVDGEAFLAYKGLLHLVVYYKSSTRAASRSRISIANDYRVEVRVRRRLEVGGWRSLAGSLLLLLEFALLVVQHGDGAGGAGEVGRLPVEDHASLLGLRLLLPQADLVLLRSEDVGPPRGEGVEVGADVHLLARLLRCLRGLLLVGEAGLEVLVHLRRQDVLPAGVALLQELPPLGLRNHLLLHGLGDGCVLLDAGQQLPAGDAPILWLEGDGVDQFEVVPVDGGLAHLLALLLLLPPHLLLPRHLVVVHQSAGREDGLAVAHALPQPLQLLLRQLQDGRVGLDQPAEVAVALGGGTQELELRVVLLPLRQRQQEVAPIAGSILRSVLDDGLLSFSQLLRQLGYVLLGVRLTQLHEDFLQEAVLGCPFRLFLLD